MRTTVNALLENEGKKTQCLADLSNGFFVEATLPSTEYIYLDIGLDCRPQYTLKEALGVITMMEEALNKRADAYTEKLTDIKTRINVMLHGISQLMGDSEIHEGEYQ